MVNVLDKIIEDKKESLKAIKEANSLDSIENTIKSLNNFLNFKEVITNNKGASLITEIKKASPSAGELVKDFNHLNIAKMYVDNGATCLSVLTEEKHFLGKLDYIRDKPHMIRVPMLTPLPIGDTINRQAGGESKHRISSHFNRQATIH